MHGGTDASARQEIVDKCAHPWPCVLVGTGHYSENLNLWIQMTLFVMLPYTPWLRKTRSFHTSGQKRLMSFTL